MYLNFYGFDEKPFNTTPDPRFLYMTPGHREALAQLVYSVQDNRGFLVLTGETGTGKTTLLHALLERLDAQTAAAFVFNSLLPFDGILEYMLGDFNLPADGVSAAERLRTLSRFLRERRSAGLRTVLIVDEAQNLSPATLEQVRLLSSFETPKEKLLQILLVGQPELRAKLRIASLRQLCQRVELFCRTSPLSREETVHYVRTRLRVAGARDVGLFTERAIARIADHAGGIPRLINILCDHSLVIGYADQKRRIDTEIVRQAIAYVEEGRGPSRHARGSNGLERHMTRLRWALGALAAAIAGGFALLFGLAEGQYAEGVARLARELLVR